MIYILQQPLLFVKIIFHYVIAMFVVGTFFVFRNFVETLCVSWAFSLVEYVAVWALKIPVPHTDVLKTHESQSVSTKLRESKGTGSEHLSQTCYLLPRQLFFLNLSYMVASWRHNLNQAEKIRLLKQRFLPIFFFIVVFFRKSQKIMQLFFCLTAI